MLKYLPLLFLLISTGLLAQTSQKKTLDHPDFDIWKRINQESISNDGQWVTYSLSVERGDPGFYIHNIDSGKSQHFDRGTNGKITAGK